MRAGADTGMPAPIAAWRAGFIRLPAWMTLPMTTAAVLCVLYVMLGSSAARDTFVSFFGLILLFAVFRFSTRTLLLQSGLMLLGYAGVIFAAWRAGVPG